MTKRTLHIRSASRLVFSLRAYRGLGILVFAAFFVLYMFVLPATYTGGRVGFVSLQYLSLRLGVFAFLFSILLAFIVPFAVYALNKKRETTLHQSHEEKRVPYGSGNHSAEQANPTSAAGSFLGSILPPLLCCSPFLPTLAALAGGAFPFAFRVSGFLQGFIATYETQIFGLIALILVYSLYQNAKQAEYAVNGVCVC